MPRPAVVVQPVHAAVEVGVAGIDSRRAAGEAEHQGLVHDPVEVEAVAAAQRRPRALVAQVGDGGVERQRDGDGVAPQPHGAAADQLLVVEAHEHDGAAVLGPVGDLVAVLGGAGVLDLDPALDAGVVDVLHEHRPGVGSLLEPGHAVGVVPLRREVHEHGRALTVGVDVHGGHVPHGLVEAAGVHDAGVAVGQEGLVVGPVEVQVLVHLAPQVGLENVAAAEVGVVGDAEHLVQHAAVGAALAVLVPQPGEVVGDDGAAGGAELLDAAGLGVGQAQGGGQDQHAVLIRHAVADQVVVADVGVLDALVAEHVLPGPADHVRRAALVVAVAVDPGRPVGLGVQDPRHLDGGVVVQDRHLVVLPLRPRHQRPDGLAGLEVVRGHLGVPRPGRGAVEPVLHPADVAAVAVGEVVPRHPHGLLHGAVEVGGHRGDGVAGVEGADQRVGPAQVVGLDVLDLVHDLGVVVAAEGVGALAADEAARRVRIDAVGVLHQVADEVQPVGIVEGPLVHQLTGVEGADLPRRQVAADVLVGDPAAVAGGGGAVDLAQPALVGARLVRDLPHRGMDEVTPGDLVVQGVGGPVRGAYDVVDVGLDVVLQGGPHLLVDRLGPHAVAVQLVVGRRLVAVPQVQVALGGGVVHVEPQPELVDPRQLVDPVHPGIAPVQERPVVAVGQRPVARGLGVADGPLVRPRHVRPTGKGLVAPVLVLVDGLEVLGGVDVDLVRVGVGQGGQPGRRQHQQGPTDQQRPPRQTVRPHVLAPFR